MSEVSPFDGFNFAATPVTDSCADCGQKNGLSANEALLLASQREKNGKAAAEAESF